MKKELKLGLKQRLKAAESVDEIKALLVEGSKFTQAADTTKRAWKRIADIRTAFLGVKKEAPKAAPTPATTAQPKKAKKGSK